MAHRKFLRTLMKTYDIDITLIIIIVECLHIICSVNTEVICIPLDSYAHASTISPFYETNSFHIPSYSATITFRLLDKVLELLQ